MGAPAFHLTPEQRRRVERLTAEGWTEAELAEEFNTTGRTWRRLKNRDAHLREALARGKAARELPAVRETVDVAELASVDYAGAYAAAREGVHDRTIAKRLGLEWRRFGELLEEDTRLADEIAAGRAAKVDELYSWLDAAARAGKANAAAAALEFRGESRGDPNVGLQVNISTTPLHLPAPAESEADFAVLVAGTYGTKALPAPPEKRVTGILR